MTGEEQAISRQREDNRELAARRGWTVADEYPDNDVSASGKRKRPQFDRLLEDVHAGRIDVIVAWSLDRLTRNRPDTVRLIETCQRHNITVALVRGSDLDMSTPAGRLVADILASVARSEIEIKGDRQRRAAQQRAEQGRPPLGPRLTGYTASGKLITREAEVVARIFDRFKAGDSVRGIAAAMTEAKVATRQGNIRWNPSTIRDILTNPRYAGRAVYNGAETGQRGTWKAIVDDDTFTIVQARIRDPRRKTQQGTDRKHLGSGLYACKCGRKVTSWTGNRYCCPAACLCRSQTNIDKLVVDVIRRRLARRDLSDLFAGEGESSSSALLDEVKRLEKRITKIGEDYDAELIDGRRYKVAIDKARAELATASVALARSSVDAGAASVLTAPDPVAAFDGSPLMIQRNVIDALCTVTLHPAPRGRRTFDPDTVQIDWRRKR